jgi:hypothetical protein
MSMGIVYPAAAQGARPAARAKNWSVPRTPDGQPDLQGVWDYRTITPLERPSALGEKSVLTDEDVENFEREENRRQNRDLIDPARGGAQYPAGGVVPYNEFWYDRGSKVVATRRSSLVIDPAEGRIPRTPEAAKRAAAAAAVSREEQAGRVKADSWDDRPLGERCIIFVNRAGPPMTPAAYNNNFHLFQGAGYVAILNEQIHESRIIPLDGRAHLSSTVRQWMGDSRGRWEGDTLVVETTNFTDRTGFMGATEKMHLIERFTRTGPNELLYEFTVTDPAAFARPWTAQIPMERTNGELYEYACHEGNIGLAGVLGGARAEEKAAAAAKKGSR